LKYSDYFNVNFLGIFPSDK